MLRKKCVNDISSLKSYIGHHLGKPNMRMEVMIRTMSKEARPIRRQLIELFICGLYVQNCGSIQRGQTSSEKLVSVLKIERCVMFDTFQ